MSSRPAFAGQLATCFALATILALASPVSPPLAAQSQDSQPQAVPVFVSDFELPTVPAKPVSPAPAPNATNKAKEPPQGVYQDTDQPSDQARLLVDSFTKNLLQSLQKNSFTASKQSGSRPESGVLIRGVFAEPDPMNRIRRGLLGAASGGKFLLYVGIFNLARPDAPLYELASTQSPDPRYGPVITLNNYIPLAKYELFKNPSEEDIRKICSQIVANLSTLLAANPTAFSQ